MEAVLHIPTHLHSARQRASDMNPEERLHGEPGRSAPGLDLVQDRLSETEGRPEMKQMSIRKAGAIRLTSSCYYIQCYVGTA